MPWEAVAWRIAGWDTPLWSVPSRRAGRYNRAGDPATQYLCLHPWGPWAEVLRWDDRRTEREAAELSSRLWSVRVILSAEPRRITFDDAPSLGIEAHDLVSEDYTVCQEVADEARAGNQSALLVPSAALPGTETLVILGPRALTAWRSSPVDVEVDVPAAVAADNASTPQAVLPYVLWRGAAHPGLASWKAGTYADFFEPIPTPLSTPVYAP